MQVFFRFIFLGLGNVWGLGFGVSLFKKFNRFNSFNRLRPAQHFEPIERVEPFKPNSFIQHPALSSPKKMPTLSDEHFII